MFLFCREYCLMLKFCGEVSSCLEFEGRLIFLRRVNIDAKRTLEDRSVVPT